MMKLPNHSVLAGAVCLVMALSTACSDDGGEEMGEDETTTDTDDTDTAGDGDGDATDTEDTEDTAGDGDGDPAGALSHAADIQPIWEAACVGCHSAGGTASFLDLSGDAYGAIVGVMSGQDMALQLVEAGNADGSYLLQKVAGTAAVGTIMPPAGDPLSDGDIATITDWINGGANP